MPKRKKPEEKPEEQFKRFVEAARQAELEDDGIAAESEFERLSKKSKKLAVTDKLTGAKS